MTARWVLLLLAALAAAPGHAQQATDSITTEAATAGAFTGLGPKAQAAMAARDAGLPVVAHDWMVTAANPLAVEAGARILRAGGSAADAMVAVQAVLGLVEPQSSGLGGGAFLVWYDAETGMVTTLDGRETAPLAATPRHFLDAEGQPLSFWDAVVGGRSVGTPGTPALMQAAHDRWGTQDWAGLFDPAIALAEGGFAVSPRLAGLIAAEPEDRLRRYDPAAAYFYPGGTALAAGAVLTNQPYADTLRALAGGGAAAFYDGPIAKAIVDTVQDHGGLLTEQDFASYRVIERAPVCVPYRDAEVCGMGPPSSGALTVGQILGMLDRFDLAAMGPDSPETWTLIGDASRLAFADRGRYMADEDFVPMPTRGLVDAGYLTERAALLDPARALTDVAPGTPEWDHAMLWGDDAALELPSTSHISIVDAAGNALSMTTTIENGFGSRLSVNGFLLNNELTDFSFKTHDNGLPIANRVEPGKRPRSSMAPTIVMRDGKPVLVIGSPGGSRIIGYVVQGIVNIVDFGMNPQQAVAAPHLVNRFGTFDIEAGTEATGLEQPLRAAGYQTNSTALTSGLHVIAISDGMLIGAADPRREGIALGQ